MTHRWVPQAGWKRSLFARAFILGMAVAGFMLASFVTFQLEPAVRERGPDAAPFAFVVGVVIGSAMWIVDRIRPQTFKRLGTWAIGPGIVAIFGALILLGESALYVVAAGFGGFAAPVATPLARFPSTSEDAVNRTR